MSEKDLHRKGLLAGTAGFLLWGMFPIYFKYLSDVDPLEVLAHRMVWSFVLLAVITGFRNRFSGVTALLRSSKKLIGLLGITAILVSINWGVYIYAVGIGHTKEASLGYYINPLINVLLGMVFLKERLGKFQWIALGFAGAGVAWSIIVAGVFPWIALILAFSFGLYGMLRKVMKVEATDGLLIETALLSPLALGYMIMLAMGGNLSFGQEPISTTMLALAGVLTTVPLLLFTVGARLIPYSTLGFIQFITPSMQFFCAVVLFKESFTASDAVTFVLIWIGLGWFCAHLVYKSRSKRLVKPEQPISAELAEIDR